MSFRFTAKRLMESYGTHAMRAFRHVPFGVRLGPSYTRFRREVKMVEALDPDELVRYTLHRMRRQVERVYGTNEFYRRHWDRGRFEPRKLQTIDDIKRIPVVTKKDLRAAPFDSRSSSGAGSILLNTGGSTGSPLAFTVDARAFAREWAHMHAIWSLVGFRSSDGRLTIRGHALGGLGYRYNAAHHEYQIDPQVPLRSYHATLQRALEQDRIKYIHGYPSAIAAFLREAESEAPELSTHLRRTIRGVLLGSEYPHPRYRDFISRALDATTVSWYGHSEMAVLAYEKLEPFRYQTMHSYGLAEALVRDGQQLRLIGTSFYNTATPFIRYDTEDLIDDVDEYQGVLRSFGISQGRIGEFVEDQAGRQLSLTGLVFGRHHRAFEVASHVQVHQPRPGELDVFVSTPRGCSDEAQWHEFFDLAGIDMAVRFFSLSHPIRTPSGKTPLLLIEPPSQVR